MIPQKTSSRSGSSPSLENRLLAYSAAAGVALLGVADVHAQIVVTDVSPDLTCPGADSRCIGGTDFAIDFDGDGDAEFRFGMTSFQPNPGVPVPAPILREAGDGGSDVGNIVRGTFNFAFGGDACRYLAVGAVSVPSYDPAVVPMLVQNGAFGTDDSDEYANVFFTLDGTPGYNGWIQISVGPGNSTYTVYSYGYNVNAGVGGITLGDTGPEVVLAADPIELWPPNHKYHTVEASDFVVAVNDKCDVLDANDVIITKVTSDEPDNAKGDGNTTEDIIIGDDCTSVDLRAERQGKSDGRVYTIHTSVSDNAGSDTAVFEVHVPHEFGGGPAVDSGVVEEAVCTPNGPTKVSPLTDAAGRSLYAVQAEDDGGIPTGFALEPAYPNPFNPTTNLQFSVDVEQPVRIVLYNTLGVAVQQLYSGIAHPNDVYTVRVDGTGLPSGPYLIRLEGAEQTVSKKIMLVK